MASNEIGDREERRAARVRGTGRQLSETATLFQIQPDSDNTMALNDDAFISDPIDPLPPHSQMDVDISELEQPGYPEVENSISSRRLRKQTPLHITQHSETHINDHILDTESILAGASSSAARSAPSAIILSPPSKGSSRISSREISRPEMNKASSFSVKLDMNVENAGFRQRGRPRTKRRRMSDMPYRDEEHSERSDAILIEMDRIRIPEQDILPLHQMDVVRMFFSELIDEQISTLEETLESKSRLERARLVLGSLSEEIRSRMLTIVDQLGQRQSLKSGIKYSTDNIAHLRAELVAIRARRAELALEETRVRERVRDRDRRAKSFRLINEWAEQQAEIDGNLPESLHARLKKLAVLFGEQPAGILGRVTQLNDALKSVLKAV